jgi:DNA-binding MarR family transcriptional regulator
MSNATLSIEEQIVAAIRRMMRAVDLHSRRLLEEHGLTGPQLAVLRAAAGDRLTTVSTLARMVHLSQPTVTGIVDRLERHGLVERARSAADRRAVHVRVSASGQRVLEQAPSLLQDRFRQELGKLREWQRTQMLATLQHIAAMMEIEDLDASPVLVAGSMEAHALPDFALALQHRDRSAPTAAPGLAEEAGGHTQ